MRNLQKYLSYLALLITTLVISACSGGSCATAPNNGQLPLAYTFQDGAKLYGNTAVNVNSGSSTTGTFVLQGSGGESTAVTLIATQKLAKQATGSLQRAAEISGKFNPRTLLVTGQGSESVSTLTVTVADNLPAGTYTLGLYAVNLTVNGEIVSLESQIGTLTVEVKGGVSPTPTPSPTVTPTPIPTITPTPNPSPTVTPTPTPSPTPVAGTLQIAPPAESIINSGDTTTAVVTLEGSQNITNPVGVTITSSNPAVMTVEPASCSLTTESNNCTITLTGKSAGSATFSTAASGYTSVTSESVAVVATWTWVSGSNIVNAPGNYGIKGVESSGNISGARQGSISWRDESGNFWLFGGRGRAESGSPGNLNDLWRYNPVANAWTWVSGSNITNRNGVYGTLGVESVDNIPGARLSSISWRDESGNLWLFGGDGYPNAGSSGNLNDLWRYNPVTNAWTWVSGNNIVNRPGVYGTQGIESTTNIPGARSGSISWRDESGNLWLFGGYGYAESSGVGNLNDLWKYNPVTNAWTWVSGNNIINRTGVYGTKGIEGVGNIPGSRNGSVSWRDESGNLWLFGGSGYAESGGVGSLNDLWRYNPQTNLWTWVSGSNTINRNGVYGTLSVESVDNIPGARLSSISWRDESGNLWLFGGYGYAASGNPDRLNDLWKYNPQTNLWTWGNGESDTNSLGIYGTRGIPSESNIAGARQFSISWYNSGQLWLFGGNGYAESGRANILNDLWVYKY